MELRWEGFRGDRVRLERRLEALLQRTEGHAVLLMDSAGRLLTLAGDRPRFDVTTFVSLLAADFCATRELARLLGEDQFHSIAHQGEAISLYMTQVTPETILALVYDRVTTLGLVRYAVRLALPELSALLREGLARPRVAAGELGEAFGEEALERVDQLFESPL